jgi:Tfp pilus assembly protein PilV
MHHRWHPAPNRLRRADRAASRATARRAVSAAYHRQPHVGRQAGFTLIEVCLATFVMIFGIATSLIVMQTGFKALDVARDSTLASQIMQSEIERIRLLPWNNTSTTAVDSICELPASETVALSTMFTANATLAAKFTVTRSVTADGSRPDDVRYITISVDWKSYDGRSHVRSFSTMYVKNGLYDYYYTNAKTT